MQILENIGSVIPSGLLLAHSTNILVSLGIVASIFLLAVFILWLLKWIGGRPNATVNARIRQLGGNVAINTGGLLGSFLTIAIFALVALYFIARLMTS